MIRNRVVVPSLIAAALFATTAARAVDCPQILNFGQLSFAQHFDVNALPDKTGIQNTYFPIVAIHEVAVDALDPVAIQDKGWCNDLSGDAISLDTSLSSPGLGTGTATASISDGSFTVYAFGTTPESDNPNPRSGSSLVQVGYRDVIHVGGAGTDPVEITLHRSINGSWTVTEPHGNTLYQLGTRTFTMTIHEFETPNVLTGVVRRIAIDDSENVGFLNGEQDYVFDAVPGHTLVLTLYLEAGVQCSPNLSFGDPPHIYNGCFGYVDFGGDQFGAPIGLSFSSPPGNPLTAASGFSYVPEPGVLEDGEFASLAFGVLAIARRRRASR